MNRELMDAVLASADDDDDARLVYADWCEDEGDLDRATFIRTQIERARLSKWDVKQIELEVREEKLIADHGETWLAEAPRLEGITWIGFERGFPAIAEADSFGALCEARDAIVQHVPLERITVPWPESEKRARDASRIPTLRAMRIQQAVIDDEPRWLAGSPMLEGLRELELVDGWAEEPGTRHLLSAPALQGLRRLELVRTNVGAEAVHALVAGDFPELEDLKLEERGDEDQSWSYWDGGLDSYAMSVLASWPGLARLRRLDLSYNRIPRPGFNRFFDSAHLSALESLILGETYTQASEMPWMNARGLRLKELGLEYQHIHEWRGERNVLTLHEAPCLQDLIRLDLRRGVFATALDIPVFLDALTCLEELDFRDVDADTGTWPVPLEEQPLRWVARSQLSKLHTFRATTSFSSHESIRELVAWADTEQMRWLHLAGDRPGPVAKALANAALPNLQRLELEGLRDAAKATVLESELGKRLSETGGLRFLP